MRSPLNRLSLDVRHLLFIASLGVLLAVGWRMGRIQKVESEDLPRVAQMKLEFAASAEEVEYLKTVAWSAEGTVRAQRLICWDFGFLLAYALLLSLACDFAAQGPFRHGRASRRLGHLLAWGSLLAAAADVLANLAMLWLLHQKPASAFALGIAKLFAYIQFTLIGFALVYVLAAMLLTLVGHGSTLAASDT